MRGGRERHRGAGRVFVEDVEDDACREAARSLRPAAIAGRTNARPGRGSSAISASLSESIESRSTSARAYCGAGEIGQRVDRALQDMRRGERIDLLGAAGAADVGFDHRPLDRLGRPALVPQQDAADREARGCGRRRGPTACADESLPSMLSGRPTTSPTTCSCSMNAAQAGEILRELGPADRFGRPGEVPAGIADRDADGLGSDVEPDELAATRESGGEFRARWT